MAAITSERIPRYCLCKSSIGTEPSDFASGAGDSRLVKDVVTERPIVAGLLYCVSSGFHFRDVKDPRAVACIPKLID
jgi:hypothetical protein